MTPFLEWLLFIRKTVEGRLYIVTVPEQFQDPDYDSEGRPRHIAVLRTKFHKGGFKLILIKMIKETEV